MLYQAQFSGTDFGKSEYRCDTEHVIALRDPVMYMLVLDISVFFNRYDIPVMAFSEGPYLVDILAMKLDLNSFASSTPVFFPDRLSVVQPISFSA